MKMFLMNFKLNISCHLASIFSNFVVSDPDLIEAETAPCLEQQTVRRGGGGGGGGGELW